ncbi:hypothetical protein [Kitasatospora sp. Root187]|uniref:hypothetical protein n=2 Tax=unclassified Kitasatospora TaxID=2633591 RepID=UPI00138F5768|nr:hypothetical protein [Kitasatospora sp. Root187]
MWAIGNAAFLIPAIPPNCPALLEYALRVRREATLTGKCEECSATAGSWTFAGASDNVSHSEIRHRGNCPATDQNIGPQLAEHYDNERRKGLEDALVEASAKTRAKVESQVAEKEVITNPTYETWANDFLDKTLNPRTHEICGHLLANPAQTWHLNTGDRKWRCDQCIPYFVDAVKSGTIQLSAVEEFTCDHCRRQELTLEPMVLRIGNYVIYGGLCRKCASESRQMPRRQEG